MESRTDDLEARASMHRPRELGASKRREEHVHGSEKPSSYLFGVPEKKTKETHVTPEEKDIRRAEGLAITLTYPYSGQPPREAHTQRYTR